MLQAFTRRVSRWLHPPVVPVGDLAGDDWAQVGPLPPARPRGLEESAAVPLRLDTPPPIPLDARPPKTAEDLEWEALLTQMLTKPSPRSTRPAEQPVVAQPAPELEPILAVVQSPPVERPAPQTEAPAQVEAPARKVEAPAEPPPPATAIVASATTRPESEEAEWQALIAAAKRRATPPPPPRARVVLRGPQEEEEREWELAIRRAKTRPVLAPTPVVAPRPSAVAQTQRNDEEKLWQDMIARAKAASARATPVRRPVREADDWNAAIAAAKRRHQVRAAA